MAGDRPTLGIVGAGRVGSALAHLLHDAGYRVAGVCSRTPASAAILAGQVNAPAFDSAADVALRADLTLLCVPDDAIADMAAALAAHDLRGRAVVHTAGAHNASVLDAARAAGAQTGSLHPAFPFASRGADVSLAGVMFAVEAESALLRRWLTDVVNSLGGYVLDVSPQDKALYHAALVLVSNYTVTLYALGEGLLRGLGAERATADGALNALLEATVDNLKRLGVPDALTGPLVRADSGTVAAHLAALASVDAEIAGLYRQLARLSLPMLAARNIPADELERVLREGERDHAADNP